jgi:pilus assembly protein CpaC
LFVVTPRLAKTSDLALALPTDSFKPPTRTEFMVEGLMEKPASTASETPTVKPPEAVPAVPVKP